MRALLLAILLATVGVAGCYNKADDFERLVAHHEAIQGWIVYVDCGDHGAVYYAFRVNSREYRKKVPNGLLNCAAAKVGDPVQVYYDPTDPNTNTHLSPEQAYERAKGWYIPEFFWIAVLPGLVMLASVVVEARKGKRSATRKAG